MEVIKDTIAGVIKDLMVKKTALGDANPQIFLKKVFTKKEQEHIKFNYFRKGILNINVDSSSWLYYLSLQKEALLAKANKQASAIKDIRFRIGEVG